MHPPIPDSMSKKEENRVVRELHRYAKRFYSPKANPPDPSIIYEEHRAEVLKRLNNWNMRPYK